jgi:predicted O-methyltransferase YrrM
LTSTYRKGLIGKSLSFLKRLQLALYRTHHNFLITVKWVFSTNSTTNFDYVMSSTSKKYGLTQISQFLNVDLAELERYADELENDLDFRERIKNQIRKSPIRGILPKEIVWGRRIFWYVIVRVAKPNIVIETGTDKGFGSTVIARALQMNGAGKLVTVDVREPRGILTAKETLGLPIEFVTQDSLQYLKTINYPVDLFLHDSNHEYTHEYSEFQEVLRNLTTKGLLMTDNSNQETSLFDFARANSLAFTNVANNSVNFPLEESHLGLARKLPNASE